MTFQELKIVIGNLLPPGCEVEFGVHRKMDGSVSTLLRLYDWEDDGIEWYGQATHMGMDDDIRDMLRQRDDDLEVNS